jgi:DNA-directed RNA polymerase subunit D
MIKVSNFEKKGVNVVEFDITGVDVSMVNSFRRTIVAAISIMAIEKVMFYNNSSIMNDESLAHRIGLVPLTTDLKTYTIPTECNCKGEGCARCTCKLTLDVKGPRTVYSGDMKPTDENVKPVYDKIPLIKISKDQEVKFEAEARLGLGRDHVKWQPGMAAYEIKDKNSFHVIVESYGSLPVEELIKTAFEEVEAKINQLKDKVA